MLTQIWADISLWFLSKEICLWGNSHWLIKQASFHLKHLITIESVRADYLALRYMRPMQRRSHAHPVGSVPCLCHFMKVSWRMVKDTKVQDAFVQSKVSHRMQHMLQDMSSVSAGTQAVYCTTSEQNTDITRMSNMLLTIPRMLSVFSPAVCLHISVCGFHWGTQSWKSPLGSHP